MIIKAFDKFMPEDKQCFNEEVTIVYIHEHIHMCVLIEWVGGMEIIN